MPVEPGSRCGPYEIVEPIGAGGMGEVYRATDTNLKRDVAIKVLPDSLAADEQRLARFQREAEVLAALNHPNIAQIYGLERCDGTTALVMELVDGPTLAERIAQGPLPADEALQLATQIADGLEAAHARGIVHRDLKPANIKTKPDGTVKILDFGIAKALDVRATSGPDAAMLTTPTMTQAGIVLGTAQYMSPEQARGKPVDQRTDVWAFGCVLFEMLTGQPAFGGEDVTITLARILERDADLGSLPGAVAPSVSHTIALCLAKDPNERIADIRDVKLALRGVFDMPLSPTAASAAIDEQSRWRRSLPVAAAALAIGALGAGSAAWFAMRSPAQPVSRFLHTVPADQPFRREGRRILSLAPDGQRFVYNTNRGLFVRELGTLEAWVIPGTEEDLVAPTFSPDGQSIVFYREGQIAVMPVSGGPAVPIAENFDVPRGISWDALDTILVGQLDGIHRVASNGGQAELVIAADDQEVLSSPRLLPDGDWVLFTISGQAQTVAVQSIATGERKILIPNGSDARYLPTEHLVFARDDVLLAVPFDLDTLAMSRGPVVVLEDVMRAGATIAQQLDIASNGTLTYVDGANSRGYTVVWVDRSGREEATAIEPSRYFYLSASPDGREVVLEDRNAGVSLAVWNFERSVLTRLTTDDIATGGFPRWNSAGTHIAYGAESGRIVWKASNNTGQSVQLGASMLGVNVTPSFFTEGDAQLVFKSQRPESGDDLGIMAVDGDADTEWLFEDPYDTENAELSPDGKWLAYRSDESGRSEIYVVPFPNVDDDRIQISNAGGEKPLWAKDGSELFYLEPGVPDRLVMIPVESVGAQLSFDTATFLDWPYRGVQDGSGRTYDVSVDGERFLAIKDFGDAGQNRQVVIVQNWLDELERTVPID